MTISNGLQRLPKVAQKRLDIWAMVSEYTSFSLHLSAEIMVSQKSNYIMSSLKRKEKKRNEKRNISG